MCIGFLNFTLDAENLTAATTASPERAGQLEAADRLLRDLWSQMDPLPTAGRSQDRGPRRERD
jgi:hypothetical protein